MTNRQNPLYWSFGIGTWLGVRVRISWLMPLVLAWFLFEFKLKLGGALFGVLFVSVLLHEFGHILAARAVDGRGDEILLWPLGGLAFVQHADSPRARFLTAAGGPSVNLLLCGLCLYRVYEAGALPQILNPVAFPLAVETFAADGLARDLFLLTFWFNWVSFLINLVPAYPLDGGQMARSWLAARFGNALGAEIAIKTGLAAGIVMAIVAMLFAKSVLLMGIGFLIVLLAMQEMFQMQASEGYDDSFMGYDFSQGYTSLERSTPARAESRPGLVARWRARRKAEREQRAKEATQQVEQQLDALLAKVHEEGMGALTPAERRLLERASSRYRSRGDGPKK